MEESQIPEKHFMFNILIHWGNTNQNDSKIPSYICQNDQDKKTQVTAFSGEHVE